MKDIINEAQATYATAVPRPVIEGSVRRLLRGHMQALYEGLWAIIAKEAGRSGLQIKETRVYRFDDPEEAAITVVLEITVAADADHAMALWDAAGRSVDSWVKGLPPLLRELFFRRWSFHVNWTHNGAW